RAALGGGEDRVYLRGGRRPPEEVPLPHLAPELLEAARLLLQLDSLRDRLQLQRAAERDDRAHQRWLDALVSHVVDERLVDLEDVDREALQVAERRVARPEVVDRQPHA